MLMLQVAMGVRPPLLATAVQMFLAIAPGKVRANISVIDTQEFS